MEKEIELLKKRLQRERLARKQAEQILEDKALELYKVNESLEDKIKERTRALQLSEEKYKEVVYQVNDIIYSTDLEGFITFINLKGSFAFGYSIEEIVGKHFSEFVPNDYKERLISYYVNIRDNDVETDYFELPIQSKDSKIYWLGQNVNQVLNPNGTKYFHAVARDISLRKKTEEQLEKARSALLKSEIKYRSVLENMDLGLMEVDLNGKVTRVYDRFCKMIGYEKEELLGKDAINTLVVKGYEDILKSNDESRLDGKSSVYEVKLKRKDGEEIWVLISGAPFYDELGNVIGSLGIHYEITDRKNLEANLEIAKEKAVHAQQAEQQFLANMSHEIRTPLNAIIGMSHLLKDTNPNESQIEFIDILSNSASLLKNLVSDILDISKIDAGKVEQYNTSFDLGMLTNKLKQTFSQRASEKFIQLKLEENYSSLYIYTDQNWLSQILMNLISNAIKFTNEGEITIHISASETKDNKLNICFEIIDTGIGLYPEEIKNIFSEFQQANNSIRKEFGGTGLGLSIASKLVNILGGKLETRSVKGEGSTFYFNLIVDKSIENSTNLLSVHSSKNSFAGLNLLVVEDNLMNQKYISTLLKKWDITFNIAENGQEAVDMFSNVYNLVFMDLSMPIMNGYDATKLIRLKKGGQKTPIIALTASTFLSKKQLALQSGMTDFLAKPFTPKELKRMIEKHIVIDSINEQIPSEYTFNAALDQKALEELYTGDYSYAYDMFSTFNEIIDDEFIQINNALKNSNIEKIKSLAHKVKPMFSMVGISSISRLFEEVENEKEENDLSVYKSKIETIFFEYNKYTNIIKEEILSLEAQIKKL